MRGRGLRALVTVVVLGLGLWVPGGARAGCVAEHSVEVVTFNAWGLPAPVARERKSRFSEISDYLTAQAFDVVGLQEVWRGSVAMLRLDGLFTPGPEAGDSGLGVWTPHPLGRSHLEPFVAARGVDALKKKGVLTSEIALPGAGDTAVLVTHLQAGGSEANARVRRAQVEQLLRGLARVEGPAVVMGDFNLYGENTEDRATLRRLQAAGLVDGAAEVGNVDGTYVGLNERFDRVFLKSTAAVDLCAQAAEVVAYDDDPDTRAPRSLSDHHPVAVRVGIRSLP